jgi:hypothetical protein
VYVCLEFSSGDDFQKIEANDKDTIFLFGNNQQINHFN